MDLAQLTDALQRDAAWVVFLNVLLQQLGLPVPAVPTLLLAGSLAASPLHGMQLLAAAVLASVLADWVWYLAGRSFGYRVLAGLCRLSINPGSCVSATEARFTRWGAWSPAPPPPPWTTWRSGPPTGPGRPWWRPCATAPPMPAPCRPPAA